MDILSHLLPKGHYPPDIDIPYLPHYKIDEGPYAEYPSRQGFQMHQEIDGLELQLTDRHTYEEYTRLLQSWLFFGFVRFMCIKSEKPFDLSKLVKFPHNGRPNITAINISPSIWNGGKRREFSSTSSADEPFGIPVARSRAECRDLHDVVSLTQHHATLFDFDNPQSAEESHHRALVILSVKYLIYHIVHMVLSKPFLKPLGRAGSHINGLSIEGKMIKEQRLMCGDSQERLQPSAMIMKRYLETNGWCPILAEDLLRRRSLAHVYCAAAIVRHTDNFAKHDNCAESARCVACNVDLDNFQAVHVKADCRCEPLKPDMTQVYHILEQGQIPIAHLTHASPDHIAMEIASASPRIQYTAISHVWADGLASADYNGLLRCQLARLFECMWSMRIEWRSTNRSDGSLKKEASRRSHISKRLMQRFSERRIAIWIDAICVPVLDYGDLARSNMMKRRAIELMTPTYAGASHVLVLDRRISEICERRFEKPAHYRYDDEPWNCSSSTKSTYEKVAPSDVTFVLRYSPWMGRCWTLQEGALGRSVMFQCAGWTCPVPRELQGETEPSDIQSLIEGLLSRSTSMQADEDQILANLNLLSANELSQYSKSDRVKAFIATKAKDLPLNLLLRRMEDAPQRPREEWWIPDLNSRASFYSIGKQSEVATLCDKGVIIQTRERSFWRADLCAILPCSVQVSKYEGKVFWVRHEECLFWIVLDLDVRQFADGNHDSKCTTLTLLLPWSPLCLNAHGFVGRGLCLTQTGELRTDISHPDSGERVKARPTLYNCALTMGTETSFSARDFADYASYPAFEIDSGIFLISSDIANWPRLQIARSDRFSPAPEPKFQTILLYAVFLMASSAGIGVVLALRSTGFVLGGLMVIFAPPIGLALSRLILLSPGYLRNEWNRKREYNRWVKSFAITGLDQPQYSRHAD